MEFTLREAAPEDFDSVFELLLELREHFDDKKPVDRERMLSMYLRFLERENRHVYVADADGRPVALMSLSVDESLYEDKPYMVIDELIVTAVYRGRGIGKRLVGKAVELAVERGCCELCVDTKATNEGAKRFYRERGFTHESILFEMELDEKGEG